MTTVKDYQGTHLATFSAQQDRLARLGPSWVQEVRKAAIDRFAELGFPTTKQEDWKYTNVSSIANTPYEVASDGLSAAAIEQLKASPFFDLGCSRLVFVNGRYSRELSSPGALPAGAKLGSLAEALAAKLPTLETHLARYADYRNHPFVALNTAFLEDGAYVEIPKGVVLEKPAYLLYVSTRGGQTQPTLRQPRNLLLIAREAQATVIEAYLGLDDGPYFTNAVTEIVGGEGAVVDYCKYQQESLSASHIATVVVHQGRSSSVRTHTLQFGGALDREDLTTVLDGEGAEGLLHGLYIVRGGQHMDNHTAIDHAQPHCGSREFYKGILDGKSSGVFNGRIIVRPGAQKTDSKQSNKNLLLSDDAVINTKPQLEIFADDVKCTHGATIGQIEPEALFYLRSRGIGLEEARSLLTVAFANDIIDRVNYQPFRDRLKETLCARLATT